MRAVGLNSLGTRWTGRPSSGRVDVATIDTDAEVERASRHGQHRAGRDRHPASYRDPAERPVARAQPAAMVDGDPHPPATCPRTRQHRRQRRGSATPARFAYSRADLGTSGSPALGTGWRRSRDRRHQAAVAGGRCPWARRMRVPTVSRNVMRRMVDMVHLDGLSDEGGAGLSRGPRPDATRIGVPTSPAVHPVLRPGRLERALASCRKATCLNPPGRRPRRPRPFRRGGASRRTPASAVAC